MKVDFNTKKLAKTINTKGSQLVRKIILDGMGQLIRQNPVDTGRSKANWSTSITNIESGQKEAIGSKTPLNSLSSLPDYMASIKGISTYKLGQTAFLYNNIVYMVPLAYGSSKQAPNGWVRNTAKEMQDQVNKIKGLI